MGACMPKEIRREIRRIHDIYNKTCELKQHKRVLILGSAGSGKTELIQQAISTNISYYQEREYLDYEYQLGPFTIHEHAKPEVSLRAWEHRDEIASWSNTLSYTPSNSDRHNTSPVARDSSVSASGLDSFNFGLLFAGFCRADTTSACRDTFEKVSYLVDIYYSRPEIQCTKDEMCNGNLVEFWELPSPDLSFWSCCSKQIMAVIYVIDMSSYDQWCYDPCTYVKTDNKLSQSIGELKKTLHELAQNKNATHDIATFVVLNKVDLFRKKIEQGASIRICPEMGDFAGADGNYAQSMKHVKRVLDDLNEQDSMLYVHESCALWKAHGKKNDVATDLWSRIGVNLNYHWDLVKSQIAY